MRINIGLILTLIMLLYWIVAGVKPLFSRCKNVKVMILNIIASILVVVGAVGFLGSFLSASGGLNWLPDSFEFPIGSAKNVIKTDDYYIVPHVPYERIQIYNHELEFEKGWNIEAEGGVFTLAPLDNKKFIVYTARGAHKYIYTTEGSLLASENYNPLLYSSLESNGIELIIPTFPLLLVFSHPIISFIIAVIGSGLQAFSKKSK
ncbi:MAG: hypothetical protein ACLFUI_02955 [Halanaerobiales bacterium]